MKTEVVETIGEICGVAVRLAEVRVAGHVVEQALSYDISEAEAVRGHPFDEEMDRYMQMGMLAAEHGPFPLN